MKPAPGILLCALTALAAFAEAIPSEDPWVGEWSAPSLSKPDVPIRISLLAGGEAKEQVGDYHGTGTWRAEDDGARIFWASGWTGLLRRDGEGGFELVTWKKGSPAEGPPDDVQKAGRLRS
ncbi:MAG: hypothetical protein IAE97_12580 [Chthoniobacterales bacterium]|nr:hypothetical protein [Chthoniobacterales bacterium]